MRSDDADIAYKPTGKDFGEEKKGFNICGSTKFIYRNSLLSCLIAVFYKIHFHFFFALFAIGLETVSINKCLTESPTLSLKLMTRLIRILRRSLRRSISSRVSCISLFKISNIFGASVRMGGNSMLVRGQGPTRDVH